jgi:hypothetical protein
MEHRGGQQHLSEADFAVLDHKGRAAFPEANGQCGASATATVDDLSRQCAIPLSFG